MLHNKLKSGVRISFNEVSKQKPHIFMALYVYNKTYSKEIHPGVTPSQEQNDSEGFPVSIGI